MKLYRFVPGWHGLGVLGVWGAVACGSSSSSSTGEISPSSPPASTTTPPSTSTPASTSPPASSPPPSPTVPGAYTVNFAPGPQGVVKTGDRHSLWFALNVSEPAQTYTTPANYFEGQLAPGIWINQEINSVCGSKTLGTPGTQINLGSGKPVEVAQITIRAMPSVPNANPGDPNPEMPLANQICFGYRLAATGAWVWDMTKREATWDITQARFIITLDVPQGPIDAFRIMTNSGPDRYLTQIVLTTKPKE